MLVSRTTGSNNSLKNGQAGFRSRKVVSRGFTLLEIMIVVLIIGMLLAIAVPNFVKVRQTSAKKSCAANLRKIEFAKNSYIMANNKTPTIAASEFTDAILYGTAGYIQTKPQCPGGGNYSVNDGGTFPTCDYSGGNVHTYDGQ